MELLSNRVLDPFSQGLMGKSMDLLKDSMSLMEEERGLIFCFERVEMSRRKKIAVGEKEDGYKYPLSPNGHLSQGSAAA